MCGITGIFDTRGTGEISESLLHAMNETQFHRGPDEGGLHIEPGLGLGHRRLSIIDISTGQQPMFNRDKSVCIVFNGEIYNFREIRAELEQLGYTFATHSDTETIVHSWEAWGEKCVDRLRGMFAFAIWDSNAEVLFLARDRMGIKPLHYTLLDNRHLLFGSELKALTSNPDLIRQIDPLALEEFFAIGYVADPRTIYKNVYKLPPAHTMLLKRGEPVPRPRCYWHIPFNTFAVGDELALQEELISRFKEAVDIRLVSEVPLGAFLSGGVDSSGVVAMMAGLQKEPVNTCAIGFNEKGFNESDFAQVVARKYHTNHFLKMVDTEDFDLIDQLALLYDEPYADSSAMPTYRVCQMARERVTVALSGDGGDELFAGYRRYRWHMNEERIRGYLPQSIRGPVFGTLGRAYPKADWAPKFLRAKSTLEGFARDSVAGYFHSVSNSTSTQRGQLFSHSLLQELQGYSALEVFRHHEREAPTSDSLSLIQYIDMKTYLVGDILTKVDRASMAHALEVRVPILDHKFIEWASGIPSGLKLRKGEGKYVFKKALEPYLPSDILYRQKMGFGVPLGIWFRGPLRQRVRNALLGDVMSSSGYFNMDTIRKMVDRHQSGQSEYSAIIWSLLMFESFYRQCVLNTNSQQAA